jgi:nucleotide-binding universal stress UspA family protein
MYRTIPVPLDESPLGERALPYAAGLARRSGARLVVLEVAVANIEMRNDPQTGQPYFVDLAARYLAGVAARVGDGVTAETVQLSGEPGPEIVAESGRRAADLVAMSTHGRSGLGRWLFGSVAEHVIRHGRAPVLLVPATAEVPPDLATPAEAGGGRACRILVALDGSEHARAALDAAGDLATALGATLTLLQVVVPTVPSPGAVARLGAWGLGALPPAAVYEDDPAAELAAARDYLDTVATGLRARGQEVQVAVEAGSPAATIVDHAREQGVAAIALATHGRGGLARLVLGSVAYETARTAPVPLLLVRPTSLG